MLKKFLHSIGVLLATAAVVWLIIGVVVEFHQIHVYKNYVTVWKILATKTAGKDQKKIFKNPEQKILKLTSGGSSGKTVQVNACLVHYMLANNTIYARNLFDLITPEYRYDEVLRGPPTIV